MYAVSKQTECTINTYIVMHRSFYNGISGGTEGGFYTQVKRDYPNRVDSDQIDKEAEQCEQLPKVTQRGPSASCPLRSDGSHDGQAGRLDCCEAVDKDTQI
jgi:hypothetical protein